MTTGEPKRQRKPRPRVASKRDQGIARIHAAELRKLLPLNGDIPAGLYDAILGLEHFAKHGTFDFRVSEPFRSRERFLAYIGPRYRSLRKQGQGHDPTVTDLAAETGKSESTIRLWLRDIGITAQNW